MASTWSYQIKVSSDKIERLHRKLELADFPNQTELGVEYGASVKRVKELVEYWRTGFDWQEQEQRLNQLPHFKTVVDIDGFGKLDMHFIHQKSAVKHAIPLLFVHGWPGNFLEVTKLLPLLADGDDGPAFHIVAPSLPNYGFSAGVFKPGFAIPQYAEAFHKVMLALGYDEYVTQGGDWGFVITRALAHLYPNHVKALHTNWPYAPFPSFTANPMLAVTSLVKHALGSYFYTPREASDLANAQRTAKGQDTGYLAQFSTKPVTLAFALDDSPVGLLAFLYEKLDIWTDDYPWTKDEILTWVSIYWFSDAGPGAAGNIYKEAKNDRVWTTKRLQGWVNQPLGFRYFPKELASLPKAWLGGMGHVVHIGESQKGGHFGAWEQPQDIVEDLRAMFGKGGGAYNVVSGKSGY